MPAKNRLFPALLAACLLGASVTMLSVFPHRTAQAAPSDDMVGKEVLVKLSSSANANDIVDFFEGKVVATSDTGLTLATTKVTTVRGGKGKTSEWQIKALFPWSSILYVQIKD